MRIGQMIGGSFCIGVVRHLVLRLGWSPVLVNGGKVSVAEAMSLECCLELLYYTNLMFTSRSQQVLRCNTSSLVRKHLCE